MAIYGAGITAFICHVDTVCWIKMQLLPSRFAATLRASLLVQRVLLEELPYAPHSDSGSRATPSTANPLDGNGDRAHTRDTTRPPAFLLKLDASVSPRPTRPGKFLIPRHAIRVGVMPVASDANEFFVEIFFRPASVSTVLSERKERSNETKFTWTCFDGHSGPRCIAVL